MQVSRVGGLGTDVVTYRVRPNLGAGTTKAWAPMREATVRIAIFCSSWWVGG